MTLPTNAEQLVKFADRQVRKLFDKTGAISPLYHYIRDTGEHGVFTPPSFCQNKDQMVGMAKAVFEAERALAYVFINEAWMLDVKGKDKAVAEAEVNKGLEHHPDRKEIVLMVAEDKNGMMHGQAEIIRPKGRKPYLGELVIHGSKPGSGFEGRMVGLLPKLGTTVQ